MIYKKLYIPPITPEQVLHIFGTSREETFKETSINDVKTALNDLNCRITPRGCSELICIDNLECSIKKEITVPKNADHILFLASTIGNVPEQLKNKYKNNIYKALMIDIAASELAEQTIFSLMKINKNIYSKDYFFVSPKLSPGYGSLDLTLNHKIALLLELNEKIDIQVAENGHLFPAKSVIALMFLSKK